MNHFSIGLWCAMKSRFYTKTSDNQLSGWTEKKLQSTSQSQACTKKGVMVTVRWSAAGLTHYNFPNPSKPLPKRVCSANRWDAQKTETAAASTGEQSGPNSATTPNHTLHNQRFKSWTNWAMKCCLICHIHLTPHQLTSTSSSSTSTPFSRKTLPPRAGGRKCFPRVHRILKHRFLCYRNKETYFLLAKICWL